MLFRSQFKSLLVDFVMREDFTNMDSSEYILDNILEQIASTRSDTNPFFWSDMVPNRNAQVTKTYRFNSSVDTSQFKLSRVYDFTSANYYGILVYITNRIDGQLQQTLLLKDIDYTVSTTENILTITKVFIDNAVTAGTHSYQMKPQTASTWSVNASGNLSLRDITLYAIPLQR